MFIKENEIRNISRFELDAASIGNTSTNKSKIRLPYTGPLPAELMDATGAAIAITIQVGLTVNVLLIVERDGKKYRYPVEATPEEIDGILHPFFFDADGHTRRNTGLERYSLGLWQGSYINWQRLTLDENGIDNLLFQLSPAAVERVLQHVKHSETV